MAKKILIVDDDDDCRRIVSFFLLRAGYVVLEAKNAVEAHNMANKEKPDLILMDIKLPEVNGLEAMCALKEDSLTEHIKIVALTGYTMEKDREKILAAGCDGYIPKPIVNYEDFIGTIASYVT